MNPFDQLSGREVKLIFWPSVVEIEESSLNDVYLAGLDEFYDSVDLLQKTVEKRWWGASDKDKKNIWRVNWYTGVKVEKRDYNIARNAPPEIAELVMYIGTSGVAIGIYKLLSLWVSNRNGRKLRIKFNDIELEATQLTVEEFQKLFEVMQKHLANDEFILNPEELKENLKKNDFYILDNNGRKIDQEEIQRIRLAVDKSKESLYEKSK